MNQPVAGALQAGDQKLARRRVVVDDEDGRAVARIRRDDAGRRRDCG